MPHFVVERVTDALNSRRKSINGSRVHLVGVAYKQDVNDMRESPAIDVLELLSKRGAVLSYSDPFVPQLTLDGLCLSSIELSTAIGQAPDCAVICTDHGLFDYDPLVQSGTLVVDTRNALKRQRSGAIFRL
jgi:UDP-N-acetyl-D-glucosamine dehydrogenase